jgi:hypothetical protein
MKSKTRKSYASGSTRRLVERIAGMLRAGRAPIPRRKFITPEGCELPPARKGHQ